MILKRDPMMRAIEYKAMTETERIIKHYLPKEYTDSRVIRWHIYNKVVHLMRKFEYNNLDGCDIQKLVDRAIQLHNLT